MHIARHPYFNPDCECLAVLLLNTCRRVRGHHIVSIGTTDTILAHSREVFRVAIVTAARAGIVMHNRPSGERTPSEADIKVTRDLIAPVSFLKWKCSTMAWSAMAIFHHFAVLPASTRKRP
jgi:DNA repair protein RadC